MDAGKTSKIFEEQLIRAVKTSALEVQQEARENHQYKQGTGQLKNSVDVAILQDGMTGKVFLNRAVCNYGPFVHEGTSPHFIEPKKRMALRWPGDGAFIFAKKVLHPGTKPDQFLYHALDNKSEEIENIFLQYTEKALEEVADVIRGTEIICG